MAPRSSQEVFAILDEEFGVDCVVVFRPEGNEHFMVTSHSNPITMKETLEDALSQMQGLKRLTLEEQIAFEEYLEAHPEERM